MTAQGLEHGVDAGVQLRNVLCRRARLRFQANHDEKVRRNVPQVDELDEVVDEEEPHLRGGPVRVQTRARGRERWLLEPAMLTTLRPSTSVSVCGNSTPDLLHALALNLPFP